jgi:hypothetical protein
MAMQNLAAVWQNFASTGASRLVIPRVLESRDELANYRKAVPGAVIQVCLPVASKETLRRRVAGRETGSSIESLVRRAHELADSLPDAGVADFVVETEGRRLSDLALEVLRNAHWIDSAPGQASR